MAKQGWVSIHRSIQDHWLWEEKPFDKKSAWIDLILLANHQDNKFLLGNELIEVPAGSFVTSEVKLMGRWGWGKSKLRSYLKLLEQEGMIIKKSDRKKTVIEVVKYRVYQKNKEDSVPLPDHKQTSSRPVADHEQTASVPLSDTNNNVNKDNNVNNVNNDNNIIQKKGDVPKALESRIDYQKIVDYWNDQCRDLPKVIKITKSRKQAIRTRINEFDEDEIMQAIKKTACSDFLCGKVTSFTASFDWVLKPSNLPKVLEGNYDNKKRNNNNYDGQETSNPFLKLLQNGEISNDEVNTLF